MEKLKQLVKNHATKLFISWFMLNTFGVMWNLSKDVANYISNDSVNSMIQHVIAQSIKESVEKARVDYSLELILLEMKDIKTPIEADQEVNRWEAEQWAAQLTALDIVGDSVYAKKQLKKILEEEQVNGALIYKTLIRHMK